MSSKFWLRWAGLLAAVIIAATLVSAYKAESAAKGSCEIMNEYIAAGSQLSRSAYFKWKRECLGH